MSAKIFRSTIFVVITVLIVGIVLISGILFEHFEAQIKNELKTEAKYISHALKNEGTAFFNNFELNGRRVTLISPDGTVIADSAADTSSLDNHADRKEISEALKTGSGTSVRYSETLTEKTVYYAQRLENGQVLRVSTTQYTVVSILLGLIQPFLVVLLLALILSLVLSSKVSKSIIKPINELNPDAPEESEIYAELTPMLSKIAVQKKTIDSQLKKAKQKQEEFKLITENMSEGFLVIDKSTNILTYNSAALKLLEIEGDVKNESVLVLSRAKNFRNTVEKVLNGERAENEMSLDERTYRLIANPVFEEGKTIGAVIIILDVTESVKREQLRREFTSNVSHELKTPLTSISGFAEIMKNGGTPEETVVDFSNSIYREAQRLILLVSDIIKISELDEEIINPEKRDVNLFEISENIVKRLEQSASKKNVKINLIGESALVFGDEKILDEIIYNLCDNAIKYNRIGGSVNIIITESSENVKLTVQDTGIGIPVSEQKRVFERFYRVDKSRSKAEGGTGLGLSIVKHGAAFHNAKIELESTEGKGTSITLLFKKKFI